jgi:hypothetical protein
MSAMETSERPVVLAAKNFARPDELRTFDHGSMAVVDVAGQVVGRAVFEPGWHWSEHVRPIAGTKYCDVQHVGYIVSGRMVVEMSAGGSAEACPGDVVVIDGSHDGWVVGDEPCVMLDWAGGGEYARDTTTRGG